MFSWMKVLAILVVACFPYSYPNKILDVRFYSLVSQMPTTVKFLNIAAISAIVI